jgi:MFS family permease
VAAVGAATVLSYAILTEHFPKELAGRANGFLNFFHIGAAFVVQSATGLVLQHWTADAGHYPQVAYQTARALNLAPQIVAAIWFAIPWLFRALERNLCISPHIPPACKIRQVSPTSISGCMQPSSNGSSS